MSAMADENRQRKRGVLVGFAGVSNEPSVVLSSWILRRARLAADHHSWNLQADARAFFNDVHERLLKIRPRRIPQRDVAERLRLILVRRLVVGVFDAVDK